MNYELTWFCTSVKGTWQKWNYSVHSSFTVKYHCKVTVALTPWLNDARCHKDSCHGLEKKQLTWTFLFPFPWNESACVIAYKASPVLVTCNQDGFLLIVVHTYSPIDVYSVFQKISESWKFEGQAIDIIILCDIQGENMMHQRPERVTWNPNLTVTMNSLSQRRRFGRVQAEFGQKTFL